MWVTVGSERRPAFREDVGHDEGGSGDGGSGGYGGMSGWAVRLSTSTCHVSNGCGRSVHCTLIILSAGQRCTKHTQLSIVHLTPHRRTAPLPLESGAELVTRIHRTPAPRR